jgi:hypothetical protein
VFDLWANRWRQRAARGEMIIVRYADDIVVGFQCQADALGFQADLRDRLEAFALSLHPGKTRVIEFGRFAARDRWRRGLGKPETFTFLGFTHICGQSRAGKFLLKRKSRRDRQAAKRGYAASYLVPNSTIALPAAGPCQAAREGQWPRGRIRVRAGAGGRAGARPGRAAVLRADRVRRPGRGRAEGSVATGGDALGEARLGCRRSSGLRV